MNMPGFGAEASLPKVSSQYQIAGASTSSVQAKVLPQQIILPGLRCVLDYWACNESCASWPLWRRAYCYSRCFQFYNACLNPVHRTG
jgi:hypothetical protein